MLGGFQIGLDPLTDGRVHGDREILPTFADEMKAPVTLVLMEVADEELGDL